MTVEKPKPKQLLRPITTGTNSAMNQSQFLAITCNLLEARERSRVQGAIGFGFHWLKNWRDSFKPISKRSNRNHFRHSFENRYSYYNHYNQPIGNQDVSMGTRARSPATFKFTVDSHA